MTPDEVLQFWFAGDPSAPCARFADALRYAKAGALVDWTGTPHGTLALIILLEQFSRNLHRGSPEAFAADTQARTIARTAIAKGFDHMLGPIERIFVYLPFEDSEDLTDQDESVRLFETLRGALGAETIDYAHRHRDTIRRFGRSISFANGLT